MGSYDLGLSLGPDLGLQPQDRSHDPLCPRVPASIRAWLAGMICNLSGRFCLFWDSCFFYRGQFGGASGGIWAVIWWWFRVVWGVA